ncbi:class I SAM-dependent methyltransferase [soil metagenome]
MHPQRTFILMVATLLIQPGPIEAQQLRRPQSQPGGGHEHDGHQHGTFQGRGIADVMSYLGADWLLRPTRQREEQPEKMIEALEIAPGSIVADVGAGVGYHSLILARKVGSEGIVYATDVQPQMLNMLIERVEAAGVDNVVPVLCSHNYTGLPPGHVDLALMVDVYHEAADPEALLRGLRRALKPEGRLVLVEFRGEDPSVPIKPDHKMTVAQVRKEVEPRGFRLQQRHDFLPWQHILIFEKTDEDQAPEPR